MKTIQVIAISILFVFATASIQVLKTTKNSKEQTVVIHTSAECEQCKERIEEEVNLLRGVKWSELDIPSKNLTVKFNPKKISLEQIKKKISEVGYDADEVKASVEGQQKLPACCQPGGMKK